jgi:hypothetical protein
MPPVIKIDGDLSIDDTKSACEQNQRDGFSLTSIEGVEEQALGQTVKINVASFDPALASDILDELNFVPAEAGDKLQDIKDAHSDSTFIFDAPQMFVDGQLERRVIFGKSSE